MISRLEIMLKRALFDAEGANIRRKVKDYLGFDLKDVRVIRVLTIDAGLEPHQVESARTRIFTNYIIDESPEELLYALNTRGEALIEAKRKIYDKEVPVYLKLMATADGVMVNEYDR